MENKQTIEPATGRVIDVTREIHAPVEAVWKALTDAGELERWFPLQARVTPVRMELSWGGGVDWNMDIAEQKPNSYLRLEYNNMDHHYITERQPHRLAIEFFLQARQGSTVLRIVHSGFANESSWDELYDGVRRGWHTESLSLKHYLEHHPGQQRLVAFAQVSTPKSPDEAWNILTKNAGQPAISRNGEHYVYTTPLGDVYEGEVMYYNPPMDLCGTVQQVNNGIFRLSMERFAPGADISVWIWIAGYGIAPEEMDKLRERWQNRLQELL